MYGFCNIYGGLITSCFGKSDFSSNGRVQEFTMAAATEDLTNQLLKSSCYCLNESPRAPFSNLFIGDHTLPLRSVDILTLSSTFFFSNLLLYLLFRSDTDEQLLLHLAFMQTMKVSSLHIGIPNDDSCPLTIKLYCNKNNLGFSEASGLY